MVWDQILAVLSPYMLLICLTGVTLGILWGAMPGLSTTMAMALLIGLSAGMEQYVALMFMLGVYTGSVFGGAISAVLINIPGTPSLRLLFEPLCRRTAPPGLPITSHNDAMSALRRLYSDFRRVRRFNHMVCQVMRLRPVFPCARREITLA